MFSRKKGKEKVTVKLTENPHFYLQIPRKQSVSEFDIFKDGKGFHREALTHIGPDQNDIVYIIPDKSCRLYLNVAEPRVFGNLWCPQKKFILKGEWIISYQFLLPANT
jgi:hypothetical protein